MTEDAEAFEFLVEVEDGAFEALFIEREQVEFACAVKVGLGLAESGVAGGVVITELAGVGLDTEGEDVVFDGFDAVETPVFVGDLAEDLGFEEVFGFVCFLEFSVVSVIGGAIFAGEEDSLAGEAMAESVEADSGF